MTTRRFPLVRGRKMRVTRLDGCGRPLYGDCAQVVSEGFISVALTAVINEGETISVQNASGKTCVSDTACAEFGGYGVEVTFCDVDPDLFAIMSGQESVTDPDGNVVGFRMSEDVSGCDSGFALEVWAGVPGQACSDDPNAQGSYGYILLPFVQGGVLGDFTIENAAINFTLTGASTKKGSGWGVGPYDVMLSGGGVPTPLTSPIGPGDHLHVQYVEMAPPDDTVGCLPVLNPADPDITGVAVSVSGPFAWATPTPAPLGDPMWADWGDGTYTYFPSDLGIIGHSYAVAGTYQATFYRGSTSVTEEVVIGSVVLPTEATHAVAGTPGTFVPPGAPAPANLAAAEAGLTPIPDAAWTTGQHVVLGDASQAHFDGVNWSAGAAT